MNLDLSWLVLAALIRLSHDIFAIKKVSDCVKVDLLERDTDLTDHVWLFLKFFEDLVDSSRYDAVTDIWLEVFWRDLVQAVCAHSIGLATACLAVGEDANVVAVQKAGDQVLDLIINHGLSAGLREDSVKDEQVSLLGS